MTDVTCNKKATETNWRVLVYSLRCETKTTREQLEVSWILDIQIHGRDTISITGGDTHGISRDAAIAAMGIGIYTVYETCGLLQM
ncbi:hypothetical protein IEO21_08097 [Rhodonia placenta]|uniref:Uncharacterized protein n=1 Tax=Rhodonia placenta TaxID=104341 RepID=A0A8H7NX23_9APHY|nr:hypothetical protein IEO21_08097 [Postia placenta]